MSALPETHSVVVVGAGLAGLYAARLLQPHFPDIIVLEATEQPGGRVRQAGLIGLHAAVQQLLTSQALCRCMALLHGQSKLGRNLCMGPTHR